MKAFHLSQPFNARFRTIISFDSERFTFDNAMNANHSIIMTKTPDYSQTKDKNPIEINLVFTEESFVQRIVRPIISITESSQAPNRDT